MNAILEFILNWFSLNPPAITQGAGRVFVILAAVFFLAGLVLRLVRWRRLEIDRYGKIIVQRLSAWFATMGGVGIVLAFLSYEGVRFLGARFWYPIWLVVAVIWLAWLLRYIFKHVPEARARAKVWAEKNKYLPGRKN